MPGLPYPSTLGTPASMDTSGQAGQSNIVDSQERIYQKSIRLKTSLSSNGLTNAVMQYFAAAKMKDMYSPELRELLQRLTIKCQQPMAADQLEKLKLYRVKVHRMMQYFQVPKQNIPHNFPEDKIDAVEKQVQSVLNSFKLGNPALQRQGH